MNNKKFYEEIILPELPNYHIQSWYKFLRRFKTAAGVAPVEKVEIVIPQTGAKGEATTDLMKTLQSNQVATAVFIQTALNIGADRARQILENPSLLTAKEALDLSLRAMKAQDSRIHAIGKVREDNREEEKLDRAFSNASYE